jgi:NAD(P)-dependent dehydrogenase (short-subunit alcohol dehydrogenase family)
MITGGGRGIGRAIAERFVENGAAVVLAATGQAGLDATANAIREGGGRAMAAVTDVRDEVAIQRTVAAAVAEFGRLDILVNNAGVSGPTAPVVEIDRSEWDETLSVNLTGAYLCAKHAVPHMIARRSGRVINITSIAGQMGYALRSPYAVSKWGMIALTRSLAIEVGIQGITVNAIAPGAVSGDRVDSVIRTRAAKVGRTPEEVERDFFLEPTALKRMVEPAEIASAALFLASDDAAAITGETLTVSAGFRL